MVSLDPPVQWTLVAYVTGDQLPVRPLCHAQAMFFGKVFVTRVPQFVRHCAHIFQPGICSMNAPMSVSSLRYAQLGDANMKEPGLDGRHRDKNPPKAGEIQRKRDDTLNKNLPRPIPQFSPLATLGTMREATGKDSEESVRRAAKLLRSDK